MIKSFRHKGLRRFYETGNAAGIQSAHRNRLRLQLASLDTAATIEDMDIPGFKLHPLKGDRKGLWAVTVSGNWRITFEFRDGNTYGNADLLLHRHPGVCRDPVTCLNVYDWIPGLRYATPGMTI